MKLSVIIPVYNVEQYIRSCVQSIYRQGLSEEDFEVILVNDGTKDSSFDVIEDVISNHTNIIVLEQSNQGLSVARNTGLSKASGQYILFLDSDDLLIDNTLPQLLSLTNNHLVDLLIAGFVKLNNKQIDSFVENTASVDIMTEQKSALEIFLQNFDPKQCYVWRTIYRKAFLDENNLRFIPGICFEDVPFTTECLLKAADCIKTTLTFYIYRQRENSIVSSITLKKILDLNTVLSKLWEMYEDSSRSLDIRKQLMNTIFETFSVSIWYVSHDSQLLKQREKIVSDLKQKVANLYFSNGIKQKMTSVLYRLTPCLYILLRSLFVSIIIKTKKSICCHLTK